MECVTSINTTKQCFPVSLPVLIALLHKDPHTGQPKVSHYSTHLQLTVSCQEHTNVATKTVMKKTSKHGC